MKKEGAIANKYLFAGEQFDSSLGDYYLRQRYYSPSTGRFTRRDTYRGRLGEPLTLHKYVYGNANPVNLTDPTGFTSQDPVELSRLGTLIEQAITTQYRNDSDFVGDNIYTGENTAIGCGVGKNKALCPDILNYDQKHFMEVKPFTPRGRKSASESMGRYKASLQPEYKPNTTWKAIPDIGSVIITGGTAAIYYNDDGVLFYTTRNSLTDAIIALGALTAAARRKLKKWREGGEPESSLSPAFQPSLSSTTSYIQQANISLIAAIAAASIVARYGWA